MNEIIEKIIRWYEENRITPEISFYSQFGGIWLNLKSHTSIIKAIKMPHRKAGGYHWKYKEAHK